MKARRFYVKVYLKNINKYSFVNNLKLEEAQYEKEKHEKAGRKAEICEMKLKV